MERVTVRELEQTQQALELVWRVFLEFEAPDYSPEGVREFYQSIHDETYLSKLKFYGAFLGEELVGVIATRSGGTHIALFFVDGDHQRQGVGKTLFETVRRGGMTVNSSPYAVPVYKKLGFHETAPEQSVNGLRFTPMALANPWLAIQLSDYESHMRLDSVRQLQAMNEIMREQFSGYPASSAMVLGAAGGNGLEHAAGMERVYAVDINADYLSEAKKRHARLDGVLECLCLDLSADAEKLPHADLLIANLLVEYIGYDVLRRALKTADPAWVSCVIQINEGSSFVSDSPYLHAFDRLGEVLHPTEEADLTCAMTDAGYQKTASAEYPLPNGKKLLRLDYTKQ